MSAHSEEPHGVWASVFGPPVWALLFDAAVEADAAQPETADGRVVREAFARVVRVLPFALPCPTCREHAAEFVGNGDAAIDAANKGEALAYVWSFKAHANRHRNDAVALEEHRTPDLVRLRARVWTRFGDLERALDAACLLAIAPRPGQSLAELGKAWEGVRLVLWLAGRLYGQPTLANAATQLTSAVPADPFLEVARLRAAIAGADAEAAAAAWRERFAEAVA